MLSVRSKETTATGTDNGQRALQESLGGFVQAQQIAEVRQKYHSINALKDSDKIEAVKNKDLNPFLFDDPYDGLANSMSRWAQEAPAFHDKDDATKTAIASKYYDETLAPLYQKMGASPLSKDTWLRNAWKTGLTYDPSQAYRNPLLKGALHGLDSAITSGLNATRTVTNVAGLPIVAYEDSVRKGDYTGLTGFYNLFLNMHNRVKEDGLVTGVAKSIEETGERNPTGGSEWMHDMSSQSAFWRDVTPARGFNEKATSFIVENGMLLPLFGAIGKAAELSIGLVGRGAEGIPYVENLTKTLGATKQGQFAAKLLTQFTEGLAFGNLTTDVEDKKDAWKMGLQFAAAGTLFSSLGKSASKLVDMLPEGAAEKVQMAEDEHVADLGAKGKAPATPDEYLEQYRKHVGSVLAAGGIGLQHSILEEALAHVALEENAPLEDMELLKWHQDLSDADHARWMPVLANMNAIKRWLDFRDLKLNDLNDSQWKDLTGFLNGQIDRAASEMGDHVPQVKEMQAQKLFNDGSPEGKLKAVAAVAKSNDAKNVEGATNVAKNQPLGSDYEPLPYSIARSKPKYNYGLGNSFDLKFEDPRDLAAYVLGNKGKSSAHEEFSSYYKRQFPTSSESSIQEHNQRVRDSIKQQAKSWSDSENQIITVKSTVPSKVRFTSETAAKRTESRYEYDKSGKVTGYQMGISFNWKAAASKAAEAKGGKNTTKFWQDYVDTLVGKTDDDVEQAHQLADDLRTYFNPTKEHGLQFEKSESGGGDWTNFLAFMYSYKDKLPKPIAIKLEDILMNSPKMSELLGSRPTLGKIEEFGQAIQNHVDTFTRSKWYQQYGQRNIFRSTQPGISEADSLSKWQRDTKLLESAQKNDIRKGKDFYPGRSGASIAARSRYEATLTLLQEKETAAYLAGNAKKVAQLAAQQRKFIAAEGSN